MNLDFLEEVIKNMSRGKVGTLSYLVHASKTVYLLGNGGSSAVCSHIAQDYTKILNSRSLTFDNASQLTCYSNDFGQEDAYCKWLEHMVDKEKPLVILVSSSGESKNILRCAQWCVDEDVPFVLLTGFNSNNTAKTSFGNKAALELHVESYHYGIVECAHQIFLHAIL